jgi:hypothetical protein
VYVDDDSANEFESEISWIKGVCTPVVAVNNFLFPCLGSSRLTFKLRGAIFPIIPTAISGSGSALDYTVLLHRY